MINSVLSYTECLIFSCKILLLVKYVLRCFYTKTYYCLWSRKIVWKLNQFKLIVAVQTSCSVFWLYIKNIVHFVNTRNHSSISTFFHAQAVKHQTDISDIHTVYSFLFHLQILLVNMVYLECFKHSSFLFHSYILHFHVFSFIFSHTLWPLTSLTPPCFYCDWQAKSSFPVTKCKHITTSERHTHGGWAHRYTKRLHARNFYKKSITCRTCYWYVCISYSCHRDKVIFNMKPVLVT